MSPEGAKENVYIPEHFRVHDHADAIAFMRANPFAILVSSTDDGPFATHLPVSSNKKEITSSSAATSPKPTRTGAISSRTRRA